MNELEGEMQKQLRRTANDLSLEAGKTLKMESNTLLGFYFRITLKVVDNYYLLTFIFSIVMYLDQNNQ